MRSFPLLIAAAIIILFTAANASAQGRQESDDNYRYHFEDDHLIGDTICGTPPLLQGMKRGLRVQLIRPRASFVAEMLESVAVM